MAASPIGVRVHLDWVDSQVFEQPHAMARLEGVHGILVPGGFGERGTEGKIAAVQLRPRAPRPVLRHLLRHADGGDRGGAPPRRADARLLHRVRAMRGGCGGPADRMGPRQRDARRREAWRRSGRHHAARRVPGHPQRRARLVRTGCMAVPLEIERTPPPPLRGERALPRAAGGVRPAVQRHVAGRHPARDRSSCRGIPGSSACNTTRSSRSKPLDPHPLFSGFVAAAVKQSRLV